jgi:pimeloyl-ACP methyl ester carboxylesterase
LVPLAPRAIGINNNMWASLRKAIIVCAVVAIIFGALAVFTAFGVKSIEAANPPSGRLVEVEGGRLHLVELGTAAAQPVVLLHGASTNLGDMRLALGGRLAANYRVILVDRPGHGWSDRPGGAADASPARQAKLLHQALERSGAAPAILVAHSWAGALAMNYALEYPQHVAGIVLLAPATHQWPETAAWHTNIITALTASTTRPAASPILGPVFARTLALPFGKVLLGFGVQSVFAPQEAPANYITETGAELLLRPSEFVANAQDIAGLYEFLRYQVPQYAKITAPTTIITGDADAMLSPDVHAKVIAAAVPHAKLRILPGVGHMVHFAAPDEVVDAVIELSKTGAQHAEGSTPRPGDR